MQARDITDWKGADKRLRLSERKYRDLIDFAPIGISQSTAQGRFLAANIAFATMLGYDSVEELITLDIARDLYLRLEDRGRILSRLEREERIEGMELQLKKKDGTPMWAQVSARCVKGSSGEILSYDTFARDITEQKRVEECLRRSEEWFSKIFRANPAAICIATLEEGRLIDVNERYAEMLGHGRGEMIGQTVHELNLWENPGDPEAFLAELRRSGSLRNVKCGLRRKSGEICHALMSMEFVQTTEGAVVVVMLIDISDRERAEAERVRLLTSERRARKQAEGLLERLSAIQTVTDAALSHLDFDDLLVEMLRNIKAIFEADTATILLVSKDGAFLNVVAADGLEERAREERIAVGHGVEGAIVTRGAPVVIDDVSKALLDRPSLVKAVRSLIGVPLVVEEGVIGVLDVGSRSGKHFLDEDSQLLQVLADRVALAIERARLYGELQEQRVQLQSLSRRLVELQEAERRKIAGELHDEIGQLLTGLRLMLETGSERKVIAGKSATGVVYPSRKRREMTGLLNDLIGRVRKMSMNLRPPMLDDLGLLPALTWHMEHFTSLTGMAVKFRHAGLERRFPADVETAAFRIVQEALTNVARHAGVRKARVEVWADERHIGARIEDGGCGFDSAAAMSGPSSGLAGIRERARLLGGHFSIDSAHAGTRIVVEIPLREASQEKEP